jgi:hypothetical protein
MLDDVERRRLLVEPAREYTAPLLVRLLNVDLDERAGQLLFFPWGRRLACAQAHEEILPARRLAGVKRDVLHDPVALVENAEHRHPLRHWRDAGLARARRRRDVADRPSLRVLLLTAVASCKRQRDEKRNGCGAHAYSGIQGS